MQEHEREYFVQRSPFWNMTQRFGCRRYATVHGMYYPTIYTDEIQEYWKLVNDVTLWDVTAAERPIEVTGKGATEFVNLVVTRDIEDCPIGQCRYIILVDSDGRLVTDSVLLRLAEQRFWMSGDVRWLQGIAIFACLDVTISCPDVAIAQLQGPKSRSLIGDLLGEEGQNLRFFHLLETDLNGIPVIVTRTGWSGELGYEFYLCDTERADEFWSSIMAVGRKYDIAVTASSEIRRVEAGILNGGTDFTGETNPYEVGLGRWVDLDKSRDFIGKATLRRILERGTARQLVGIEIEGELERRFLDPWPVIDRGNRVGKVTMAVRSPSLEKTIGYAMVPRGLSEFGCSFQVIAPSGERRATVVPLPFVDPKRQRAPG